MSGPYDAVLTWHTNPLTCGVANFNVQLAERLGVPCWPLRQRHHARHALVSLKTREVPEWERRLPRRYTLLLHDRPPVSCRGIQRAQAVYYVDDLGCPPLLRGNASRGGWRVLTYGYAHKRVLPEFEKLRLRLDRDHPDYTISLSVGVHEGSPWEPTLEDSVAALRGVFGDRLRVLGFLADDALAREIHECDAVAAFFDPALRANNSSAWLALSAGKRLYTNTDALSPTWPYAVPTWDGLLRGIGCQD